MGQIKIFGLAQALNKNKDKMSEVIHSCMVDGLKYKRFREQLDISENDIEITIFDTPKFNWGIRGLPGDELALNYKVNI